MRFPKVGNCFPLFANAGEQELHAASWRLPRETVSARNRATWLSNGGGSRTAEHAQATAAGQGEESARRGRGIGRGGLCSSGGNRRARRRKCNWRPRRGGCSGSSP